MKTKRGLENSKHASRHIVGKKLVWTTPEDYRRILLLKEDLIPVSDTPVPGNVLKQYDIFCTLLGF